MYFMKEKGRILSEYIVLKEILIYKIQNCLMATGVTERLTPFEWKCIVAKGCHRFRLVLT